MKKSILFLSIAVCLLLWSIPAVLSQDEHPRNYQEDKTYSYTYSYIDSAGLDSFITAQMIQKHLPGVSACIVKKGQIIWTGNYGWAYINNIPVYDSTLFQVVSLTKTVTATALMKLYERGRFGLDDTINAYLPFTVRNPFYPNSAITFRMLMTHTSSIRDNYSFMPYFHLDAPGTLKDYLVKYFTPDSMYYSDSNFYQVAPGISWNYTNIGTALEGYLVEAITNIELNEFCQDSVFTPLGMNETSFFYRDLDTMHMAMPYRWYNSNFIPYGHYGYHDYPSGLLKTSTIQLARFLITYMQYGRFGNVRILDSATVRMLITPQIPLIYPDQGLEWRRKTLGTRVIWGHNGGDLGISTRMYYCPNDTTGILFFANRRVDLATDLDSIMNEMFNYASVYVTSVSSISSKIPSNFKLFQNYPNPFNPTTMIKFGIPKQSHVRLVIYDVLGREMAVLINEVLKAGEYKTDWDASAYPSGVYFYRIAIHSDELTSENYSETKRMVLIK